VGYFEDAAEGHGYQKRKREAACGWFLKWLKDEGDGGPAAEPALELPAWNLAELRCFPAGHNKPAGPGLIDLATRLTDKGGYEGDDPVRRLHAILGVPYPLPLAPAPDLVRDEDRLAVGGRRPAATAVERVAWRMSDGVLVPATLLRPEAEPKGVLVAVADGGKEALLDHAAVRAAHDAGWAVVLADLRGMGELAVTKPGWVYAISLLMGENHAARQALDLIAGVRALRAEPWMRGRPAAVFGSGLFASTAALYAAVMEKDIAWLAGEGGLGSFRHMVVRGRSAGPSFALAEPNRERDVTLDREMPHALVPWGIASAPDIPDYLKLLGKGRAVWAAAIDGDFEPLPGPSSALEFIRARLEEAR
jgi:hypothetical protein